MFKRKIRKTKTVITNIRRDGFAKNEFQTSGMKNRSYLALLLFFYYLLFIPNCLSKYWRLVCIQSESGFDFVAIKPTSYHRS